MLIDKLSLADQRNDIELMQDIVLALMFKRKITMEKSLCMEYRMRMDLDVDRRRMRGTPEHNMLTMVQKYTADLIMQHENK